MVNLKPDDIFSRLYPPMEQNNQTAVHHRQEVSGRRMVNHNHNHHDMYKGNPTPFPAETPLAMAYIYFQQWGETCSPEEALEAGTLFPDLNKPFEGGRRR